MRETKRHQRTFALCCSMILSGLAVAIFGGVSIIGFVSRISRKETMTTSQLVHELILPHIILLCGLGVFAGGIILMIRISVIRERLKHDRI
jgi:hypothetical protein